MWDGGNRVKMQPNWDPSSVRTFLYRWLQHADQSGIHHRDGGRSVAGEGPEMLSVEGRMMAMVVLCALVLMVLLCTCKIHV